MKKLVFRDHPHSPRKEVSPHGNSQKEEGREESGEEGSRWKEKVSCKEKDGKEKSPCQKTETVVTFRVRGTMLGVAQSTPSSSPVMRRAFLFNVRMHDVMDTVSCGGKSERCGQSGKVKEKHVRRLRRVRKNFDMRHSLFLHGQSRTRTEKTRA